MCRAVTCRACGKTTWAGCGQHVDRVMRGVPASQRCTCDRDGGAGGAGSSQVSASGLLSRILGRRSRP